MRPKTIKPLVRLRRYGFKLSYHQRVITAECRQCGDVPTAVDDGGVRMSRHFVAADGKTYVSHTWIWPGGSTYSYATKA